MGRLFVYYKTQLTVKTQFEQGILIFVDIWAILALFQLFGPSVLELRKTPPFIGASYVIWGFRQLPANQRPRKSKHGDAKVYMDTEVDFTLNLVKYFDLCTMLAKLNIQDDKSIFLLIKLVQNYS